MAQVTLNANYDNEPEVACRDLSVFIHHVAYLSGVDLQSVNISGAGNVSITYTGQLSAATKAHLAVS